MLIAHGERREMTIETLRRTLEPAIRRVLHFYWRFARGMTLGVRAVVVNESNQVFLVEHSYVTGWHLPGGGVETGETLRESLGRELMEEGGITLLAEPVLHGVFHNTRSSRRDHVAVFIVRAFRQEGAPRHPREIIGHGFFALDALPAGTTRGTRARLAEVFHGAPVSPQW
jgi:ADP-ribose pyrophosphatase YjhB (NUDIX family)